MSVHDSLLHPTSARRPPLARPGPVASDCAPWKVSCLGPILKRPGRHRPESVALATSAREVSRLAHHRLKPVLSELSSPGFSLAPALPAGRADDPSGRSLCPVIDTRSELESGTRSDMMAMAKTLWAAENRVPSSVFYEHGGAATIHRRRAQRTIGCFQRSCLGRILEAETSNSGIPR